MMMLVVMNVLPTIASRILHSFYQRLALLYMRKQAKDEISCDKLHKMPSFKVFLSFFCFLLNLSMIWSVLAASSTVQKNVTDTLALQAFKDQLTSDSFEALSSWNSSLHFCHWRGVTCGRRHARVTALDLEGLGLEGPLSPHLGNLSFLRVLSLGENHFYGEIPHEVGRLFRLQFLNISFNSLHGEIPINLSKCSQLTVISMNKNKLVGNVPHELSSLSKLEYLELGANELTGEVPPSLGNLSSLFILALAGNGIEGPIPNEIGRLSRLRYLWLGDNYLSGKITTSIYNLTNLIEINIPGNNLNGSLAPHMGLAFPYLQQLYVARNQLSGRIPISLVNASHLTEIELARNHFSGKIPIDLGRLQNLSFLNIGRNELGTGKDDDLLFMASLSNCSKLSMISISYNNLTGSLPRNFSSQLVELYVGNNHIHGSIPSGISNLIGLIKIGLDSNLFTGAFPSDIGKLKMLQGLNIFSNFLSGQIPASIGNLTRLVLFYAHQNGLNGQIPFNIGNCTSLEQLVLADNLLSGSLPKSLSGLFSLNSLILENNLFSGSIPADVGKLINLNNMWVYGNKFSGNIPSNLGDCATLVSLRMSNNMFSGTIPESLSSLKGMQELDLSHNNLSGEIPKYLANFVHLEYLNLSFNNFEGMVPNEGIFRHKNGTISLVGNEKICGGVQELHLNPCFMKGPKEQPKGSTSAKLIALLATSGFVILMILSCLLVRYLMKKLTNRELPMTQSKDHGHLKVSYADIVKATENFSPTNLIGTGSFGSVYKGYMDSFKKVVAIKVLHLECRRAFKSFMAECGAMKNIRHRNLLRLLTSCSSLDFTGMDFKALIFDFMPNGDLENWLHHQDENNGSPLEYLSFSQRLDVAIDVACALVYLHNQCDTSVVHRDLKPSNVLFDEDMVAHLSDFGLAKVLTALNGASSSQNSTLALQGSIGYIPPEYGIGGEITTLGDVYSYGVLLLEMFTGKRPTNSMFTFDLDLPTYARMAFPDRVIDILDQQLLSHNEEIGNKVQEGSTSLIEIGIACTATSPRERIGIQEAFEKLLVTKELFLGIRERMVRQNWNRILEEGPSYLSYF